MRVQPRRAARDRMRERLSIVSASAARGTRVIRFAILFVCVVAAVHAGTAAAEDWLAGAGPEWQRTLDGAKKEGHVAVVGPPELAVAVADGFLKDTGVEVDYLGGVAAVNAARVSREVRAGNVTVDVMFTGTAEL